MTAPTTSRAGDARAPELLLEYHSDSAVLILNRPQTRNSLSEAMLTALSDETKRLLDRPANAVTFIMGNGEAAALAAWKSLKALGATNVYVVDGGVNRWLELYAVPECVARRTTAAAAAPEALAFRFAHATGEREPAAWPERAESQAFRTPCEETVSRGGEAGHGEIAWPAYAFTKKVKLQTKAAVKGGCG